MKKKYKDLLLIYLYFLLFLQLAYFYLINDILYNSTKEKYFNFSVYVNLFKLILPRILKIIFKDNDVPKIFVGKIGELFKIWKDRWNVFDNKFYNGLIMYTYDFNSSNNIEEYYSQYIKIEQEKYLQFLERLTKVDPKKLRILGEENGLYINSDFKEIINDLQKIQKIELIIDLSKDIDGNATENATLFENETSKIQRILKSMNENFNNNRDSQNNKEIFETKPAKKDDKELLLLKEDDNDIDGEPI